MFKGLKTTDICETTASGHHWLSSVSLRELGAPADAGGYIEPVGSVILCLRHSYIRSSGAGYIAPLRGAVGSLLALFWVS
jgi:hypothetical protein